jgi:hypothetical protein
MAEVTRRARTARSKPETADLIAKFVKDHPHVVISPISTETVFNCLPRARNWWTLLPSLTTDTESRSPARQR